jgi:hypothetical protein
MRLTRAVVPFALVGVTTTLFGSLFASPAHPASSHLIVGFNATSPALVQDAAAVGVTTDVLYNGPPTPTSTLGRALEGSHMSVVDASISTDLYFWECHRTHTVAPPPAGQKNDYCRKDFEPGYDTEVLLDTVAETVSSDASNPLVIGYWVLDDWPSWDGGSAKTVLQQIHQKIANGTPGYPAICGFGGTIEPAGVDGWDPSTGQNYSNQACDMVGFYNYANQSARASSGTDLDWSMSTLLPAMKSTLSSLGWNESVTPLLGIGQAWSGRFAGSHEPGLSSSQVLDEASAFCSAGATSIGWYGWTDSGFHRSTQTPVNSTAIDEGIEQSINHCVSIWDG